MVSIHYSGSAHPEMVMLTDLCVALKILSSEFNYMLPVKFFARFDLDQNSSFLEEHYVKMCSLSDTRCLRCCTDVSPVVQGVAIANRSKGQWE